jgi:broad specificity phosphatase PhoE
VRERFTADFAAYAKSIDAPCTGGESIRGASGRLLAFFEKAEREWDGKTVLVCSHALCCRLLAALAATGRVEDVLSHRPPDNASYAVYEYENGNVRALLQNHTAHLDNNTSTSLQGLV